MKALLAAAATAALLTTGCAQALPNAAASSQDAAVADIQSSVTEAMTATKSFGQKHLGHYLQLDRKDLRAEGYTPADGVSVTIYIDHYDLCINATSAALPEGSEWSTATATSKQPEPVAGGSCSVRDSLKRVTLGG